MDSLDEIDPAPPAWRPKEASFSDYEDDGSSSSSSSSSSDSDDEG